MNRAYILHRHFLSLFMYLKKIISSEDSKYWYLTELAAQCTAKRMVPDYISEKKMKELKVDTNGNGQLSHVWDADSFLTRI